MMPPSSGAKQAKVFKLQPPMDETTKLRGELK
jgi:hypothetical protein